MAQGLSLSWGQGGGGEGAQLRARPHPAGTPPSAKSVESDTREKPSTYQMLSRPIVNTSHQLLKESAPSSLKKAAAAESGSGYLGRSWEELSPGL